MKPRTTLPALFLSLIWVLWICLPAAAVQEEEQKKPEKEEAAAKADAPVVKLLDPGKEPRRTLRLEPEKGQKETAVLRVKTTMTMEVGGQKLPAQTMPEQKMTMEMTVKDVSEQGDISYEFKVVKAEVEPADGAAAFIGQQLAAKLKEIEGLSGKAVVSSRGISKEAKIDVPEDVDPMLRNLIEGMSQSFEQLTSPLPEEAVGVGGKWEVLTEPTMNGIRVRQKATYEVASLGASSADLKLAISQNADPQDVRPPGAPPGVAFRLVSLDSDGSGSATLDLSRLVPASSKAKAFLDAEMVVDAGGTKQPVRMGTDIETSVEGK